MSKKTGKPEILILVFAKSLVLRVCSWSYNVDIEGLNLTSKKYNTLHKR
jgi:hypothetical protein